jgi:hypothetical protein
LQREDYVFAGRDFVRWPFAEEENLQIDSRDYQHVIEARSGVMAESFFKYTRFAVIENSKAENNKSLT